MVRVTCRGLHRLLRKMLADQGYGLAPHTCKGEWGEGWIVRGTGGRAQLWQLWPLTVYPLGWRRAALALVRVAEDLG